MVAKVRGRPCRQRDKKAEAETEWQERWGMLRKRQLMQCGREDRKQIKGRPIRKPSRAQVAERFGYC